MPCSHLCAQVLSAGRVPPGPSRLRASLGVSAFTHGAGAPMTLSHTPLPSLAVHGLPPTLSQARRVIQKLTTCTNMPCAHTNVTATATW